MSVHAIDKITTSQKIIGGTSAGDSPLRSPVSIKHEILQDLYNHGGGTSAGDRQVRGDHSDYLSCVENLLKVSNETNVYESDVDGKFFIGRNGNINGIYQVEEKGDRQIVNFLPLSEELLNSQTPIILTLKVDNSENQYQVKVHKRRILMLKSDNMAKHINKNPDEVEGIIYNNTQIGFQKVTKTYNDDLQEALITIIEEQLVGALKHYRASAGEQNICSNKVPHSTQFKYVAQLSKCYYSIEKNNPQLGELIKNTITEKKDGCRNFSYFDSFPQFKRPSRIIGSEKQGSSTQDAINQ